MTAFSFDNIAHYPQSNRLAEISTPKGQFLGREFVIKFAPAQAITLQKGQFLGRAFAIQSVSAQAVATGSLTYRGVAY